MKALSNRLGFALAGIATTVIGISISAVGCSSSGGGGGDDKGTGGAAGGGNTPVGCATSTLTISFNPMYSAYIPNSTHTFQIPAIVNGVSGATVAWSVSDKSKVLVEPGDTSGGALLTMQGSGDVTVTATAGSACGTATLHITEATDDQWNAGNARYNNSNKLPTIQTDGGIPVPPPGGFGSFTIDPPDAPPACTNCHGDTATSSYFRTVSHTPEQTGGFTDTELISIFTQATIPTLGYFDTTIIPQFVWGFFHKWSDITGDEAQGMVVYLRSLTPKTQNGMVDFGGGFMGGVRTPVGGAGGTPAVTGTGGTTSTGAGGKTGNGGSTTSTGGKSGTGGAASTGGASSTGGAAGAAGTAGTAGASAGGAGGGAAGASSGGTAGSGGTSGAGGN
jgi:hypothetical protein